MLRMKSVCVLAAVAALALPASSAFAGGCDSFRGSVSVRVGNGYFSGGYASRDCAPRYVAPRCDVRPVYRPSCGVREVRVIRERVHHGHGGHHGHYRGRRHCD
jgi:hypothetical protein